MTLNRSGTKKSINRSESSGTNEYKNSASENYGYGLKVSGKTEWTGECGTSAAILTYYELENEVLPAD